VTRASNKLYWLIGYSSSCCASQRTDASPHTNYLFRFLKSDLHAGRRQKRNYNLHPHPVNLSNALTVEGIWVSATGHFVAEVLPRKAAQFTHRARRVNT
jgi:hypothetical protein